MIISPKHAFTDYTHQIKFTTAVGSLFSTFHQHRLLLPIIFLSLDPKFKAVHLDYFRELLNYKVVHGSPKPGMQVIYFFVISYCKHSLF